jgi:heme/copper-type cytochrome/quinol oxidase subunit 3
VQAGYFAMQVHEYAGDLGRFAPADHAYASIYYTLLGADHAHVALGLLLDLWLLAKLARGLTRYRLNALSAITFYWHAVNVLTIAVTLTILSPSL